MPEAIPQMVKLAEYIDSFLFNPLGYRHIHIPGDRLLLRSALLGKISFWLIIIGMMALITPQPAWPEWLARMILSTGIALGITTIGLGFWNKRAQKGKNE